MRRRKGLLRVVDEDGCWRKMLVMHFGESWGGYESENGLLDNDEQSLAVMEARGSTIGAQRVLHQQTAMSRRRSDALGH